MTQIKISLLNYVNYRHYFKETVEFKHNSNKNKFFFFNFSKLIKNNMTQDEKSKKAYNRIKCN